MIVVRVLSALVRSPVDALDVLPERGAVGVALLAAGIGAHVCPVDGLNLELFLIINLLLHFTWALCTPGGSRCWGPLPPSATPSASSSCHF